MYPYTTLHKDKNPNEFDKQNHNKPFSISSLGTLKLNLHLNCQKTPMSHHNAMPPTDGDQADHHLRPIETTQACALPVDGLDCGGYM